MFDLRWNPYIVPQTKKAPHAEVAGLSLKRGRAGRTMPGIEYAKRAAVRQALDLQIGTGEKWSCRRRQICKVVGESARAVEPWKGC